MSDKTQMVTFPRELSDELAELIAEKARVCGGGAFEIWEAICEQFGQSVPAAVTNGQEAMAELDRVARELRAYNPKGDEYKGMYIYGSWAARIRQSRVALSRSGVAP
jgi:hypothetical protein